MQKRVFDGTDFFGKKGKKRRKISPDSVARSPYRDQKNVKKVTLMEKYGTMRIENNFGAAVSCMLNYLKFIYTNLNHFSQFYAGINTLKKIQTLK